MFQAELVAHQAGDIGINHVRSDEHVAHLNQSGISRLSDYHFYLLIQKSGQLFSTQHGVESHILPGDSILVDSFYPFKLNFPNKFECISIKIPRILLFPKLADVKRICTSKMRGSSHLSQAIFHYMHYILNGLANDSPEVISTKTEMFLNLIATSGSSLNQENHSILSPLNAQKLMRIKKFVYQNFDSDLTPIIVAHQFNISVNYLHKIFAQDGTTFGEHLRKTRLTNARKLLLSTESYNLTILEIAFQTGFKDLSHFNKAFKQMFGLPPGKYRKLMR